MDARTYLERISEIDRKITRLQSRLDDINAQKTAIKSPANMQHEAAGGPDREERLISMIEKAARIEKVLVGEIDYLIDLKEKISREIDGLPDKRHKDVLYYRYVRCMRWEDVAKTMNYNERWVKALGDEALESFREMYLK